MTFWDGTRWVPDAPTGDRPHPGRRMFGAAAEALLLTTLVFGLVAGTTLAAKGGGGHGGGHQATVTATCVVTDQTVTATELPTWQVVNFMVTSGGETWGWVLGMTDTGTMTVRVPPREGPTTYQFVSRTYGRDGAKYDTFAACQA